MDLFPWCADRSVRTVVTTGRGDVMRVHRVSRPILAVIGMALVVVAAPPSARAAPAEPAVAYMCARKVAGQVGAHICVSAADGSGERIVSSAGDNLNIAPVWSPDGTRIAYLCRWDQESGNTFLALRDVVDFGPLGFARNAGGEVCVVDAAGGTRIVRSAANGSANAPAWSPDSRFVLYSTEEGIQSALAGNPTFPTPVIVPASYSPDFPAWSPDGTKLAFTVATDSGTAIAVADISYEGLVVPQVGQIRQLTPGVDVNDLGPTWSPDSTQIAFTRYEDQGRTTWIMGVDGNGARRVGETGGVLEPNRGISFSPLWSPDGRSLYVLDVTGYQAQIARVPIAGGSATVMTRSPVKKGKWGAIAPSISPDGKTVVFVDDRAGANLRLHAVDVKSGKETRRSKGPIEGDSSWRPMPGS
jgi:Tol biopolymer transport system component